MLFVCVYSIDLCMIDFYYVLLLMLIFLNYHDVHSLGFDFVMFDML